MNQQQTYRGQVFTVDEWEGRLFKIIQQVPLSLAPG